MVRGFSVSDVGPWSATLTWDPAPSGSGYIYVVSKAYAPPDKFGHFVRETSHIETGLAAATTYYAHIRTSCRNSVTSAWVTVQFNTPAPNENNLGLNPPCSVQAYPMETQRSVTVKVKGSNERFASVTLIDVLGRKIKEYTLVGDRLHIEVSTLAENIYFLRYNDALGRIQTLRFTKI